MDNENAILWDGASMEPSPRRPNIGTTSNVEPKTSKLNAEASEWFPASHVHNHHAPTSFGKPKISAQSRLLAVQNKNPDHTIDIARDLSYLHGEIFSISADPGRFEEVIEEFMQTLKVHYENNEIISKTAELVFHQAIHEASFQYNAARLCFLIEGECPLFKSKMEDLCKKEAEKSLQKPGFAMFLAELYTQTDNKNWQNLYSTIDKLLATGGEENIKTVCKILKLCGMLLESFDPRRMSEVIQFLMGKKSSLQQNCQLMIDSVIKLKTCNWGHNEPPPSSTNISGINGHIHKQHHSQFEAYGPDDDYSELNELENMTDPDELYDPEPEMDEEIQAAFKEFVKMSK